METFQKKILHVHPNVSEKILLSPQTNIHQILFYHNSKVTASVTKNTFNSK